MTLSDQIAARLEDSKRFAENGIEPLTAALLAVLELHRPVRGQGYSWHQDKFVAFLACATCGIPGEYGVPWPCPELHQIASALGIEVERE